MTEPQGTVFGEKAVQQIARTVREVSRRMMNEQPHRGRWHFHGGGGGGGHEIFFEIESVTCDETGAKTLYVTALWYDGGCTKTIPGADQYDIITVIDPCGELAYYTAEWLGSGSVKGWAKYMYPRGDGYCEPEWLVRSICGVPGCS
jgi:hypothetical protein